MRPIAENTVIQIEITNDCHLSCANCTRHVGHHREPFYMDLDTVERAIDSLDGCPSRIGIMGGEPVKHPLFAEICDLVQRKVPADKREFWTAGFRWGRYEKLIKDTFPRINFNDHIATGGRHHPLLVAIEEVVDDPELRRKLIDNCPYQSHWSASITPHGAYFCEIAASMGALFGIKGWPIEPGWWRRGVADYKDQIDAFCGKCSGALPMPAYSDARGGRDKPNRDIMSPGNYARLTAIGSPKVLAGGYEIWDRKITAADLDQLKNWQPRQYRDFEAHTPEDVKSHLTAQNIG